MKKIYSILLLSGILGLSACNLLDMSPVDYNSAGNFWTSEAKVQTFYNGLLTNLRSDYTSPLILGEFRGGTLITGSSIESVGQLYDGLTMNNPIDKNNPQITNWNSYYGKILQVNDLLDHLETGCEFMDDATRNLYRGRGYGLRAYYYFMLYRTYGGVPLEKTVKVASGSVNINDLYLARSSAEETLQFIKDDILRSEEGYGNVHEVSRTGWSYYATELLKARVYLWSAKVTTRFAVKPDRDKDAIVEDPSGAHKATWPASNADLETAKAALQAIVASGEFSLEDNFADIYSADNKAGKEIILVNHFDRSETTNTFLGWFAYQAAIWCNSFYDEDGNLLADPLELCGTGTHRVEYLEAFVKSFDKADARRAATFHECYTTADPATRRFGSAMIKYMGHREGDNRYADSDMVLMRYADVLLSLAEVENALGNYASAAEYVNQIRERAYGGSYPTYTAGSFAENEKAILVERDKEFVAEGTRWFDLLRMQDANHEPLVFSDEVSYRGTAALQRSETQKLLWPIDAAVLAGDDLIAQTVGY
ncbi:MAG: RagB/SusD family nutrient uptake outer membrane protein [Bacteroidales bacterium]|nr:RagB/SusD family nutrient uptake outer membrane protein [Bacteroidales bacterium]MBR1489423.1 RagB/SusD family nutrient uptake outer membrane protein [Bacteroidales bacterium]